MAGGVFSGAKLHAMTIRESATDGSDFTNPDADYRRLFLGEDGLLHLKDSAGTVTDVGAGGSGSITGSGYTQATARLLGRTTASTGAIEEITVGSGLTLAAGSLTASASGVGLLAVTSYGPTSVAVYTTTSTTLADVDATNLQVTFTAPASGNILVRLSAYGDTATADAFWGLRESTTDLIVGRSHRTAEGEGFVSMPFYLTGISGGSHTYKWSYAVNAGGSGRIIVMDGSAVNEWAPGVMEVWAAP